jgi:hypothetical protein
MPGLYLEILPPELQSFYGVMAAGLLVIGLFVWGAGIRLARPAVAVLVGLAAAALAVWGLPGPTGIAPITAGIIGFVAGLLAGAVTFRFVQAFLLAACLALVVSGVYYRTNILPFRAATPGQAASANVAAKDLLIRTERLDAAPDRTKATTLDAVTMVETARAVGNHLQQAAVTEWQALSTAQQQRLGILAGLAALAGLLIALFFPRQTTWISTAALGTLMVTAAGLALLQVYGRQYVANLPTKPAAILGILGGIFLAGLLVQRLVFWPTKKKRKSAPEASPVPGSLPGEPAAA